MATSQELAEFHDKLHPHGIWQYFLLMLFGWVTICPPLELNGFFNVMPDYGLGFWLVVATLVSGFVGAMYYPGKPLSLLGLFPGLVAGPSILLATYAYTAARHVVYEAELIIVTLIVVLPAGAVYYWMMRLLCAGQSGRNDYAPEPFAAAATFGQSAQSAVATSELVEAVDAVEEEADLVESHSVPEPVSSLPVSETRTIPQPSAAPLQDAQPSQSGRRWLVVGSVVVGLLVVIPMLLFFGGGRPRPETRAQLEPQEISRLVADLRSADAMRRQDASGRLAKAAPLPEQREEVAAALAPLLKDTDVFARRNAVAALGVWHGVQSVPSLIAALEHPDVFTRRPAMEALAKIKDPQAIEAVAARLANPQDRNSAGAALRAFGPAAEVAMLAQLTNQDLWVRMEACKVLEEIGTDKCLPALQTATSDSNGLVSSAAKAAISAVTERSERVGR